ncbi:hypothetical protein M758_3G128400 [Ceratodon purpureus]|nr:hypothetical protein M758_3G128400 [Ceratodon purpureus]
MAIFSLTQTLVFFLSTFLDPLLTEMFDALKHNCLSRTSDVVHHGGFDGSFVQKFEAGWGKSVSASAINFGNLNLK